MLTLAAGIVGTMLAFPRAHAQQAALTADVPAERMRWIADGDGVLDVEWGGVLPSLSLQGGLGLSFADDPLTIYTVNSNGQRVRVASPVKTRGGGELVAAVGIADLVQVGMAMPFVISQSSEPGMLMLPATSSAGFGDIRLHAKLAPPLLTQSRIGVDIAAMVVIAFPTASGNTYFGDASAVAEPGVAVSRRLGGGLRGTINLAYRARDERTSAALVVDDELVAAAGLGFRLAERDGPAIEVDASWSMATPADPNRTFDRNYSELKLGASFAPMRTITVLGGGGVGLAEGYGTPNFRLFAGVRFAFSVLESFGGDDEEDEVELQKIEVAEHGSIAKPKVEPPPPPPDDDHDGLAGAADTCPYQAETANGYLDEDGCPDTLPDGDKDGKPDRDDRCPAEPEDIDGFTDDDGCPDLDDDADGVADAADRCPRVAGVAENGGCPDPDTDGDTVVDRLDNCPQEAGTPANAGCKDKQLVRITADRIEILDTVYFRTDRADIRSKSYKLLDNVARVLIGHPDLQVRVEGHTDDDGDDAHNKDLSQRRAESVVAYLAKKGVPAGRLTGVGYGEEQPVADNKTRKGKAANRRVVFAIVPPEGELPTTVPATPAPATPAPTAPAPATPTAPAPAAPTTTAPAAPTATP